MTAPRTAPARGGLTEAEAGRRLETYGPNAVETAAGVALYTRVLRQLRDPLILVLLGASVLTILTGDTPDTIVILLVVVLNTVVGVAQEIRADRAVTALGELTAPEVRVIRDGAEREIPSARIVPGDIVLLGEGDVVPADGTLTEASALLVDESALTGESVPVDKAVGADDVVRSGTVVVRGRAVAEVTATGAASALGRIASLVREAPGPTPLQRRLAQLGRILAIAVIGLCAVVFVIGLIRGEPADTMAVTAISLAVAAVPESLPAVVTLGLALGARRMAARRAVVRNLPAVETLGSVTVLATDKTGTLTEGRMVTERLWTPWGSGSLEGTGYDPHGALHPDPGADPARLTDLLIAAALCNDATLVPPDPEADPPEWTALGDPTEAALLAAAGRAGLDRDELAARAPRVAEVPFDSVRKRMTTIHRDGDAVVAYLKGAPEVVLSPVFLDVPPERLDDALATTAALAADGYRVLAVARRVLPDVPGVPDEAEHGLDLLGLVAIQDPPKAAARETVRACREAGITPVMITGDHPATARAIAVRLGIVGGADAPVLTGADLAEGRDPTSATVLARTTPEQKLDIVRAWQSHGAVTAMNGDGVNDGPALRRADIGVAMGRRGTEVARQAADLVLADDEISTVVAAVEEGRRVYDNIRRFLLFGLSGGTAEIAVMLLGPAMGMPLPLLASQILWINLLTHGLTGVAMGAEPVAPGTMRRPPRPPDQSILGDHLWDRVLGVGAVLTAASLAAGAWGDQTGRPWQTILFLTLLAGQLGVVMGLRPRPFGGENPFLPIAVAVSALLGVAGVYLGPLQDLLGTEALSAGDLVPALLGALAGFAVGRLDRWVRSRARGRRT